MSDAGIYLTTPEVISNWLEFSRSENSAPGSDRMLKVDKREAVIIKAPLTAKWSPGQMLSKQRQVTVISISRDPSDWTLPAAEPKAHSAWIKYVWVDIPIRVEEPLWTEGIWFRVNFLVMQNTPMRRDKPPKFTGLSKHWHTIHFLWRWNLSGCDTHDKSRLWSLCVARLLSGISASRVSTRKITRLTNWGHRLPSK